MNKVLEMLVVVVQSGEDLTEVEEWVGDARRVDGRVNVLLVEDVFGTWEGEAKGNGTIWENAKEFTNERVVLPVKVDLPVS